MYIQYSSTTNQFHVGVWSTWGNKESYVCSFLSKFSFSGLSVMMILSFIFSLSAPSLSWKALSSPAWGTVCQEANGPLWQHNLRPVPASFQVILSTSVAKPCSGLSCIFCFYQVTADKCYQRGGNEIWGVYSFAVPVSPCSGRNNDTSMRRILRRIVVLFACAGKCLTPPWHKFSLVSALQLFFFFVHKCMIILPLKKYFQLHFTTALLLDLQNII